MNEEEKTAILARLNDTFRSQIPYTNAGPANIPGQTVMTRGIAQFSPTVQSAIILKVKTFSDFTEDNDPYGTHEFGAFDVPKVGTVFWKIDIYESADCEYGSEHPTDPKRSYRVLTILFADEY